MAGVSILAVGFVFASSVTVKILSHLICVIRTFYKCRTFNAICKDHAAINFIAVGYKKGSFPSTLTGHTRLV